MNQSPLVYLILGTPHSGRRKTVKDLIESICSNDEKISILINTQEINDEATAYLKKDNAQIIQWDLNENNQIFEQIENPLTADRLFFFTHAETDLINQIEAFKNYLGKHNWKLTRALAFIDCRLLYQHDVLKGWFEALIHFSDYVLLTHYEKIPNKWIDDYIKSFEKKHFPCLFEKLKNHTVKNPQLTLDPEPLRITQAFEEQSQWEKMAIEYESEEPLYDPDGEESFIHEDPYFERREDGSRKIKLPEIGNHLIKNL